MDECDYRFPELLLYKGIVFDDFVVDTEGVWAKICNTCKEKYSGLDAEIEFDSDEYGYCGVQGCEHQGTDEDEITKIYYIDFRKDEVKFKWSNGVVMSFREWEHFKNNGGRK